jgi:hypothetical protein
MLEKDDLAFEVRHLVTEFPLLREAQTLPSLSNRGSLLKVTRRELGAEHTSPSSAYLKDEYSYVPTPLYDVKLWTGTALPYCLLTSGCYSLCYVSRHYKRFPPHNDRQKFKHVSGVQIVALSVGRFLPSELAWHCRHCNIGVPVLLTAATSFPQLLLLWPLTSDPYISKYFLTIAVVIFKINLIFPHTASHCQVSHLLSRFYFRNISVSYRYTDAHVWSPTARKH